MPVSGHINCQLLPITTLNIIILAQQNAGNFIWHGVTVESRAKQRHFSAFYELTKLIN
jgi:hypothetical protein